MEHRNILKTLANVSEGTFNTEEELLSEVLNELVENEQINVDGGRIWQLNKRRKAYTLLFQGGRITKLKKDFVLRVKEYEVLDKISIERTILADETHEELKRKGILKFSASGVGNKIKVNDKKYYEYLLALNSPLIDEKLRYTINIVATVLTNKIKEHRFKHSSISLIEDVDKAKQLQKSILPEHEYEFSNFDIFGVTVPAKTLGGDFFDYLPSEDGNRLGIAVGDAASKGIAAAAEAMYISGAIRMASSFEIKISGMMNRLNLLINKIFSDDRFASLFYCELSNSNSGLCLYANAGHNPPIFMKKNGRAEFIGTTGPLLGPVPNVKISTESLNFAEGDILLIYSDGLTEAADNTFSFYGENRLKKILRLNKSNSSKDIAYSILDDVIKFSTSDSKYQDDKTIVVVKRKKNGSK